MKRENIAVLLFLSCISLGCEHPSDEDLGMTLPQPIDEEVMKNAVEIHVNKQGQVSYGKEQLPLDQDAEVRDLPLLKSELEKMQADDEELAVTIFVDPGTTQQRVIDVLNTLASVNISRVTFSDLIDEK